MPSSVVCLVSDLLCFQVKMWRYAQAICKWVFVNYALVDLIKFNPLLKLVDPAFELCDEAVLQYFCIIVIWLVFIYYF